MEKNEKSTDLGFAQLDLDRMKRRGCPETVFCQGKTPEQIAAIFRRFAEYGQRVLGTRATAEQFAYLQTCIPEIRYDETARLLTLGSSGLETLTGAVAVCCAGTSDLPVAEEAALTAEFFGARVERMYDIGIAGLHRLLDKVEDLRRVNAVIAVAGMEGALGGVIAGLVSVPVIAVPTSVGYGASFEGLAPLLTMLNSCAEGMSVVNIDNGFGAGYLAAQINRIAVNGGPAK
ncbi:MAG: nickel pincer cofactor biosynthesis protein LarB [Lentisphaeria bacterium]|nr:nickel pincer cofactor biosynthesis protein LarB [Lentisphaeria bacterium]